MTTPGGVPNLPAGALTVSGLADALQNVSQPAMRERAGERIPSIFGDSTGGDVLNELSPFGFLANLWAGFNSAVANADPADVQGPEDLPDLLISFIEEIPLVGILVKFIKALGGDEEAVETFLKPIFSFFEWLWELFGGNDETLRPIFEFIESIWSTFGDAVLRPLVEFLGELWDTFGEVIEAVAAPILTVLGIILDALGEGFEDFLSFIGDVLTWLFDTFGDVLESILKPAFGFIGYIIDQFGNVLDTIVKPIMEWLVGVWQQLGDAVLDILQPLIDWLEELFQDGFSGIGDFIGKLAESFLGFLPQNPAELIDQLTKLALKIPIIGGLVSQITGLTPKDGVSLDLSTIGVWAQDIERKVNETLDKFKELGEKVAGQIPVSQINLLEQNLLAQGTFLTSSTIDPGSGWVWDSTTNATNTGGSAKVVATGSQQVLYGTQSVKVTGPSGTTSGGDRLTLTALVKTSGFTSGSIQLAIIPWVGTSRLLSGGQPVTQIVATRTTASGTFNGLNGTQYTIPATVTSVQVALLVAANSGAQVWFDDIRLSKTGLLVQGLVGQLTAGLAGIIDGLFGFNLGSTTLGAIGAGANALFNPGRALFDLREETQTNVEDTNTTLFGDKEGGVEVRKEALPLDDIGKEINPTAGSGALLTRKDTANRNANIGRHPFSAGFYTHLDVASTDISAMTTGGVPGTGERGDYSGIFRVSLAGWYLCEISVRLNASFAFGQKIAPMLRKGTTLTNLADYKIGADTLQGARYAQSTFIVYLNANDTVQAGFDGDGYAIDVFDADASGVETYFSISLLNKSYA